MLYPERDILAVWKVYNKISVTVSLINSMYYIDSRWNIFEYSEYLAIFAIFLFLIKDRYIIKQQKQQKQDRIISIYLLHILFITPLFHNAFCTSSYLFPMGIVLCALSFLPFHISKVFRVLSCLFFTSGVGCIESANGFIIVLILSMYAINRCCDKEVYRLRGVSLAINILCSNLSNTSCTWIIGGWEMFCTVISPLIIVLLYQNKHRIQTKRKKIFESRDKTYLFTSTSD